MANQTLTTEVVTYFNYNVDLNNTGLSFVLYSATADEKYAVQTGLNKGFQMTGELLKVLQDPKKFPDVEVLSYNQELTGATPLDSFEVVEKITKPK